MTEKHPFEPVYDCSSEVLILGSFPSVKSREQNFYYGHPRNRFWQVMAAVLAEKVPYSVEDKKNMLLKHGVALWDSIAECEISGSSDSSIRNAVPNDISGLLGKTRIHKVYCNGSASFAVYQRYVYPNTGVKAEKLPSTSPANAVWSIEQLTEVWIRIKER